MGKEVPKCWIPKPMRLISVLAGRQTPMTIIRLARSVTTVWRWMEWRYGVAWETSDFSSSPAVNDVSVQWFAPDGQQLTHVIATNRFVTAATKAAPGTVLTRCSKWGFSAGGPALHGWNRQLRHLRSAVSTQSSAGAGRSKFSCTSLPPAGPIMACPSRICFPARSDADPNISLGIALVGTDAQYGAIQYSTDGGVTWQDIGSVSPSEAFLLSGSSNDRVRLNPNTSFVGSLSDALTFHAWDESIGQSGQMIDLGSIADANAVSTNIDSLAISSLQVSTLTDENDGNYTPGHLSLREALAIAYQSSGNLTITFAPGLTGQILLNSPLTVGNSTNAQEANVSIQGPGAGQLTINANGSASVFSFANNEIAGYDFSLSGVKLTGATGAAISESVVGCIDFSLMTL